MKLDDVLPAFIAESLELLKEMETGLLECGGGAATPGEGAARGRREGGHRRRPTTPT